MVANAGIMLMGQMHNGALTFILVINQRSLITVIQSTNPNGIRSYP